MSKALYPGTFDPVTLGHQDVIERSARVFERLIVAIGNNPAKECLFSMDERVAMMKEATAHLRNVEVKPFDGLMVNFARREGVSVILRGIRTVSDLEYEIQMAFTNRASGGVETVFIAPRPEFAFINARFIKEIASCGGDVSHTVNASVQKRLHERFDVLPGGKRKGVRK
jgi:pantetheine-phosphate adenylyltransferase